ncbi:alpha-(1,3)-fucosyltransferase C-like [Elysia marginata]|uniref:Fucosyltransferase n=1 Tax=Elysia marginata TaxID=1093978 RepID=A0AAV4I8T4_9GAST|nr:alpha-(1,3)-fucosyltransferase C-like [Elysia marginata]
MEDQLKTLAPAVKPGTPRYRLCLYVVVVLALILFSLDAIFYQGVVPHIPGMVGNTITKMGFLKADRPSAWYNPFPDGQSHQPSLPMYASNVSVYLEHLRNTSSAPFHNGTFFLGGIGVGGRYSTNAKMAQVPTDLRRKLKDLGMDPAEDHTYKSPYIITPAVYPQAKIQRPDDGVKTKIISIFNAPKWYRRPGLPNLMAYHRDFKQCPYYKCEVDMNGKKLQEADIVVFFVGQLGARVPPPRPKGQLWAKAYWESPAHYNYPKNYAPWKSVFNLTYNFRVDSDIFAPNNHLAWRHRGELLSDEEYQNYAPWKSVFNLTYNFRVDSDIFAPNNHLAWRHRGELLSDEEYLQIALRKTKPVAWWVSNCHTQSKRESYVKEMRKYIPVDVYGKCGSLQCTKTTMLKCKQLLNTTYNFYLSFENSLCRDYISEKFYRNYESRTHIIPVVRGGADYQSYFPPEGFVDASKFPKARDLALYLQKMSADPQKYARMLREKDRIVTLSFKHDWCDLCRRLHTTGFPAKSIPDIKAWSHKGACHGPNDIT